MNDASRTTEPRTPRDAQLDPVPGDIVQKGRLQRRVVERVGGDIWYINQNAQRRLCWLSTWQHWTSKADILAVAHASQRGEVHE